MLYKVQSVTPEENFILSVVFADGVRKKYDLKPLFEKWPVFRDLRDIAGLYRQVKVDIGGLGISWNDTIDLAAEELRVNGIEITDPK